MHITTINYYQSNQTKSQIYIRQVITLFTYLAYGGLLYLSCSDMKQHTAFLSIIFSCAILFAAPLVIALWNTYIAHGYLTITIQPATITITRKICGLPWRTCIPRRTIQNLLMEPCGNGYCIYFQLLPSQTKHMLVIGQSEHQINQYLNELKTRMSEIACPSCTQKSPESYIRGDNPKTDLSQDAFNFEFCATRYAKVLANLPCDNSTVTALTGEWGSGKTTLLNFIRKELEKTTTDLHIVKINTWEFANNSNCVATMFTHIAADLPADETWKKWQKIYKSFVIAYILPVGLSLAGGFAPHAIWGYIHRVWMTITHILKNHCKPTLQDSKNSIAYILQNMNKQLLIIFDDLDRIDPDTLCNLFKTVKCIGDIPGMHYLLAYDERIVHRYIETRLHVDGKEYIEKIVQRKFKTPIPTQHELINYFARLNHVFDDQISKNIIQRLYQGVFPLLKTPRQIIRLTNTLSGTATLLENEIDLGDLITMEFIRMEHPEIFETLAKNYTLICADENSFAQDTSQVFAKLVHQLTTTEIPPPCQTALTKSLLEIFPRLHEKYDSEKYKDHSKYNNSIRLGSVHIAHIYFKNEIPASHLTRKQRAYFKKCIQSGEPYASEFVAASQHTTLNGTNKLASITNYLTECIQALPADERLLASNIKSLADTYEQMTCDQLNITIGFYCEISLWIVLQTDKLFKQMSESKKHETLDQLKNWSLAFSCDFIDHQQARSLTDEASFPKALITEQASTLMSLLQTEKGNMAFLKNPASMSRFVDSNGGKDILKLWACQLLHNATSIYAFLIQFQGEKTTAEGTNITINMKYLEELLPDHSFLRQRIVSLMKETTMNSNIVLLFNTFLQNTDPQQQNHTDRNHPE